MKAVSKILIFSFLLLAGSSDLYSQQELGLHFMDSLSQTRFTNPGRPVKTSRNVHISVATPVFNFGSTGFTYLDLMKSRPEDDSINIFSNIKEIVDNKLNKNNYVITNFNLDILSVRFPVKEKNHFSLDIKERFDLRFKYPRDFVGLIFKGNGHSDYLGNRVDFGLSLDMDYFREYALGYAREFENFSIGGRLKFLTGFLNVTSFKSQAEFYVSEHVDTLQVGMDYLIKTSGFNNAGEFMDVGDVGFLTNLKNPGGAIDIGGAYHLNKKISFYGSLLDLGGISWKDDVTTLTIQDTFTYTGVGLNPFFSQDTFKTDSMEAELTRRFTPEEVAGGSYWSWITPKLYLSAEYRLDSFSAVHALVYAEFFDGVQPAFAVGYKRSLGKAFDFNVNYSIKNRSFLNLGLGWNLNLGPFQIFAVGDNLSAFFIPKRSKSYNLRMGMNVIF